MELFRFRCNATPTFYFIVIPAEDEESANQKMADYLKELQLPPDSWQVISVAGQPREGIYTFSL